MGCPPTKRNAGVCNCDELRVLRITSDLRKTSASRDRSCLCVNIDGSTSTDQHRRINIGESTLRYFPRIFLTGSFGSSRPRDHVRTPTRQNTERNERDCGVLKLRSSNADPLVCRPIGGEVEANKVARTPRESLIPINVEVSLSESIRVRARNKLS